jgi:hypothetical protein
MVSHCFIYFGISLDSVGGDEIKMKKRKTNEVRRKDLNKEVLKLLSKIKKQNKNIFDIGIFIIDKEGLFHGGNIKAFKDDTN